MQGSASRKRTVCVSFFLTFTLQADSWKKLTFLIIGSGRYLYPRSAGPAPPIRVFWSERQGHDRPSDRRGRRLHPPFRNRWLQLRSPGAVLAPERQRFHRLLHHSNALPTRLRRHAAAPLHRPAPSSHLVRERIRHHMPHRLARPRYPQFYYYNNLWLSIQCAPRCACAGYRVYVLQRARYPDLYGTYNATVAKALQQSVNYPFHRDGQSEWARRRREKSCSVPGLWERHFVESDLRRRVSLDPWSDREPTVSVVPAHHSG